MSGQPIEFDFATVIPIEKDTPLIAPFCILEAGEDLMLRAYFHCGGDNFKRDHVSQALDDPTTAEVAYFFNDLQAGGNPLKVPGGEIKKLDPADVEYAFGLAPDPGPTSEVVDGELKDLGLDSNDDYYISILTNAITTGPGNMLQIPAGSSTGTWRVLTLISGEAGTHVSAFDDSLVIQVIPA